MGNKFSELAYTPHTFHLMRERFQSGYSNPDEIRLVHMTSFNRKHRYKEHYMEEVGTNMTSMTEF